MGGPGRRDDRVVPSALRYSTGAVLALLGRLGALVLGGVVAIALARWLGPSARGEFALVTLVPGVLVAVAGLGVGQAEIVLVSRDPGRFGAAVGNALLFSAVASVVVGVLTVAAAPLASAALPILRDGAFVAVIAVSLPPLLFYSLVHQLLQAMRAFGSSAALLVVGYVLFLGALVGLVGWLGLGLGGALAAWLGSHFLLALAGLCALARTGAVAAPDLALLRAELAFGAPSWVASLALYVATRAPVLVAGAYLLAEDVGLLSVAITLAELLWYGAESASVALGPLVARATAPGADVPTSRVARVVLLGTAAGAAAMAVVAEPLLRTLFGSDFAGSVATLRWLLPGVVALGVAKVVASDLYGRGRPGAVVVGLGSACVVSVASSVALVPALGIVGAAVASTAAYLVAAAALLVFYIRASGAHVADALVPRPRDLVLVWGLARALVSPGRVLSAGARGTRSGR